VKIAIYDMLGQEVRTLVSEQMDRGTRIVEWNGRDNNGAQVTSGMYIYRMTSGSFVQSHKMMLLK
jgi:flagellar hook assembly protein FlgD